MVTIYIYIRIYIYICTHNLTLKYSCKRRASLLCLGSFHLGFTGRKERLQTKP